MKCIFLSLMLTFGLVLAGCTSSTPAAKKAEKPPAEPIGGQQAAFLMFQAARQWASDVQLMSMENIDIEEVKSQPGKFGAWRATFVSPQRRQMRTYTYGVEDSSTVRKGVFSGNEQAYIPRAQQLPFYIQALKTDSPAALEAALTDKELKAMAEKNPDTPVQFLLECTAQTQMAPAWRVIWGHSIGQSMGSGFVNADTGKFIKRLR